MSRDGYQWLADEHRDIAARLAQYESSPDDTAAHSICEAIDRHVRVVESALLPVLRREIVDGELLAEGAETAHATLQTLIARVYVAPPEDLDGLMGEIRAGFERHVREEGEVVVRLREAGVDPEQLGHQIDHARTRAG